MSNVSDLIKGLGSRVSAMFNGFSEEVRDGICSAFGTLLVDLTDGVCNISPQRRQSSSSNIFFPPILPKEFAIMIPSGFVQIVIRFRFRLEKAIDECYIDTLEEEHRSLRYRYLRDPPLKDIMKDTIGYHEAWMSLQSQFPKPCEFSSCLATTFQE
jgi:hypothetical protein